MILKIISSVLTFTLLSLVLIVPETAQAQRPKGVKIDQIRVGFPHGGSKNISNEDSSLFKAGFWTPVYVDITAGDKGIAKGELIVETTDSEDIPNNYTVSLPRLDPGEQATVIGYTRPGSIHGNFNIKVRVDKEEDVSIRKNFSALDPNKVLYLSLGSRLGGLRNNLPKQPDPEDEDLVTQVTSQPFSSMESVDALPTRWFAYAPLDLLILTTGNEKFVNQLLGLRDDPRLVGLATWIRQGGRIVISAGRNHELIGELMNRLQLDLPVEIKAETRNFSTLPAVDIWLPARQGRADFRAPAIPLVKLEMKPGREAEIRLGPRQREGSPLLVVSCPQGLGQVTLVAFDLDQPPFTSWNGQADFWKKLLDFGPAPVETATERPPPGLRQANPGQDTQDLTTHLQNTLGQFEDVPVISFGWVALFIFLYILVVGPLDYLFLKKVVGRLEWTWITFPLVVLVVSAAAYFAAYALKGSEQRINKMDIVDVDLRQRRLYGTTWFTVFSPRIQNYTLAVEPSAPTWSARPGTDKKTTPAMITWAGRADSGYGGSERPTSQSLFHRAYNYDTDALGLEGVPIKVWASKAFWARWETHLDPSQLPVQASLARPTDEREGLEGTLTFQLGGEGGDLKLEDAVLIHGGKPGQPPKVYPLGALPPGVPFQVRPDLKSVGIGNWVPALYSGNAPTQPGINASLDSVVKQLMFQEAYVGRGAKNALRYLDQSWRLLQKDEAILVGRLSRVKDAAETVAQGSASPSLLWLGSLPSTGTRKTLAGTMAQETYLRVFIPLSKP